MSASSVEEFGSVGKLFRWHTEHDCCQNGLRLDLEDWPETVKHRKNVLIGYGSGQFDSDKGTTEANKSRPSGRFL